MATDDISGWKEVGSARADSKIMTRLWLEEGGEEGRHGDVANGIVFLHHPESGGCQATREDSRRELRYQSQINAPIKAQKARASAQGWLPSSQA